jgi:hypothetical protein
MDNPLGHSISQRPDADRTLLAGRLSHKVAVHWPRSIEAVQDMLAQPVEFDIQPGLKDFGLDSIAARGTTTAPNLLPGAAQRDH